MPPPSSMPSLIGTFGSRCESSASTPWAMLLLAATLPYHDGLLFFWDQMSNKALLLEVTLVIVVHHSNRKVSNTMGESLFLLSVTSPYT